LSLLYNLTLNENGSYSFLTKLDYNYTVSFLEYTLTDSDGNNHVVYNFVFHRDKEYSTIPFHHKYDEKIKNTILSITDDFFKKNDHKALLYFCHSSDGYGRHRKIVFNKWMSELDASIENYNNEILYAGSMLYASLIIKKDNPLNKLISDAFEKNMELLEQSQY